MPQKETSKSVTDIINGIEVRDPYRWLENGDDTEVKEWVKEQNSVTNSSLRDSRFEIFSEELAANFKVTNFSTPSFTRGRYFYTERAPDEDQGVLYMKIGLDGVPVKLVDPNGLKKGNTVTIDYWDRSRTGKYIAYGLSEGGDEMATLYVKDVDKNEDLSETIPNCRYSAISWMPDDSGFFYTRNPSPGAVPVNEKHLYTKVYFHRLGENPAGDQLIFGEQSPKDVMISINLSIDGRHLGIQASNSWNENDVYIYETAAGKMKTLISGLKAKFSIGFLKDKVIINTDYKANNKRVLSTSYKTMYKPIDEWEVLIPERDVLLESIRFTKSRIIVEYLRDVCSEVFLLDHNGNEVSNIPLPTLSFVTGFSTNREEEEFFYGVNSYLFPQIVYHFDPSDNFYLEYKKTESPIDPEDYEIKREWYASKDGVKVPVFIMHKKGLKLNGASPTVLYGYGGFHNSVTPVFRRNWVPWFERGGIFVVANIRGGGEFGDSWHKCAIKAGKQLSYDDFISAAEFLISKKYTCKTHIGILGESNGGLLVSAVSVQRPDLFKAVCSRVPLTDMVRFPKFGIALRWIHEYGNPELKEDLINILKWSPYHNVHDGVEYPATFFMTAEKDTRVDPLHSRKMTALLQSVNGRSKKSSDNKNRILLYVETNAGHGAGKPISKIVENQALILAFFAQELGLKI